MKAETETAQRLDLWRKKLFETCATLLREPGWQTTACAEIRELGLETEVEELASMNKTAQERIVVLSFPRSTICIRHIWLRMVRDIRMIHSTAVGRFQS